MEDVRNCAQCGVEFEPRREHARFCSAECRIIWNRENASGQHIGDTPLNWSVAALEDTAERLRKAEAVTLPEALAVISESVWWVTLVDATMIRYHHDAYDHALADLCADAPVAAWIWRPVPAPVNAELPQRARTWETGRYLHYRIYLAGRPVGETINRAAGFLTQLAAAL